MSITLQELLALVGHLDNAPGFDVPRERLRRFLLQHVDDAKVATTLIEQGQHSLGEQNHYALQDLVTLLGRFLGFETAFGTYEPIAGALKYDGHWHSRGRLHVVVEIRSDRTPKRGLDGLTRSLSALASAPHSSLAAPHIGLCVLMPSYAISGRDELVGTGDATDVRVATVQTIKALAQFVGAGRLRHEDVLRLLSSRAELDFVVDLLQRCAAVPLAGIPKLVERR